jgi:hypothetical protein
LEVVGSLPMVVRQRSLFLSQWDCDRIELLSENVPVGLREKGFEAPVYFRVSVPIYFVVVRSPSFGVF